MAISFVNATGNTQTADAGDVFTLLKPTNAATGDVIICGVVFGDTISTSGALPTGWIPIGAQLTTTGGNDGVVVMGYRVVKDGDPASWTDGITPTDTNVTATITSCYRGVDISVMPVLNSIGAWALNPGTVDSGNANNDNADNWCVGFAALVDETVQTPGRSSGTPATSRDSRSLDSTEAVGIQLWDSDGSVATGNHNLVASETGTTDALFSWVTILRAAHQAGSSLLISRQALVTAHNW